MASEPQPFFKPLIGSVDPFGRISRHDVIEAGRVATAEQMAHDAALGRPRLPKPELPVLKAPSLPDDFTQRLAALDREIFERGLPVDADRLRSLGQKRFKRLLELDRKARSWQKIADFTRFDSVQTGLQAFQSDAVPKRKTAEQVSGSGKERDEVRKIGGFDDLWKVTTERQELIDDVYNFHDAFESLRFGHAMLESLGKGGRVRSRFFCGGKRRESDHLTDWLSVVDGSLSRVTLVQPIWSLVAWLADESAEAPSITEIASDFFNVRIPSEKQLAIARATLDGFLLDYDDWYLWQYVGRRTRAEREVSTLAAWRTRLAKRFPKIAQFHAEMRAPFHSVHGYGAEYHHKFEPAQHRVFIDRMIRERSNALSAVLALAMEASFPGAVLARFDDWILCKEKPEQRAEISAQVAAAFPGSNCQLEISEIQP